MTDLAGFIAAHCPANHDLGQEGCEALALALREEEALWRPVVRHDPDVRFYHQLYRDPNVDVWVLCWLEGQSTGYHDHDRSEGGVVVCDGWLNEDYFSRGADGLIREETNLHPAGGSFRFDATYIHGVRHGGEGPATSIHVYSPALWRMGHYEPDVNGVIRRTSITYADDLLAA